MKRKYPTNAEKFRAAVRVARIAARAAEDTSGIYHPTLDELSVLGADFCTLGYHAAPAICNQRALALAEATKPK